MELYPEKIELMLPHGLIVIESLYKLPLLSVHPPIVLVVPDALKIPPPLSSTPAIV
jgi:hypothetical protein